MLKIRVVCGGREIEVEYPVGSYANAFDQEKALEIIKELCTQIKKLNE